jgi:acetyl-CoA carboxylase biotin carboxyl carrier protein
VADDTSAKPGPFDLNTIKALVRLMSQHDLSEINLREGELQIRLRRGSLPKASPAVTMTPALPPAPLPAPTPTLVPSREAEPAPAKPSKPLQLIKSPTPGTFYSASDPNAEPFVRVGSRVTPETVVCLIEAMKNFNEIQAECTGVIAEILVENQQPVEYGQVLFTVDPTG